MSRIGDYHILRELGRGGMAEVFLAEKSLSGGLRKQVVVKRILPHLKHHAEYTELFTREAALALNVRHPNLVQVLDYQQVEGEDILVLELIEGLSLADLPPNCLSGEQVAYIGMEVAAGLSALHEAKLGPILHRDVGPGNILLDRHGSVKLTDFGIACLLGDPTASRQTQARGTWRYLAPERRGGFGMYPSSDLYSLAMVLLELLGGPPDVPVELESHLYTWLDGLEAGRGGELVRHLRPWLHSDPARRPQRATHAAEQLRGFVHEPLSCREALAALVKRHETPRSLEPPVDTRQPDARRTAVLMPPSQEDTAKPPHRLRKGRSYRWLALLVVLLAGLITGYVISGEKPPADFPSLNDAQQTPSHFSPFAFWTLDSRQPCLVTLNGRTVGPTPLRLRLPPGRQQVGCIGEDGEITNETTVFLLPGANPETMLRP